MKNKKQFTVYDTLIILGICLFFALIGLVIGIRLKSQIAILISLVFSIVGVVLFIYLNSIEISKEVFKPTDSEWDDLIKRTCCHFTYEKNIKEIDRDNNNVYLKTTKSLEANTAVFFRPSVYFFIGEANKEQLKINNIYENKNYAIYVEIKDLDRNKVRIRTYDNVLVYMGRYNGKGIIKKYTHY